MIRSFIWHDGNSLPTGGSIDIVPEIPDGGWAWVDVSDEGPGTIQEVCRQFGIDEVLVENALAAGSLPTIEEQHDLIYVVLNTFRAGGGRRLRPSEVDFFIGPDFLLSIHQGGILSTSAVVERLEQGISLTAPSPAGLLAHLAMVGSRRYPILIDQLESQLEGLEELAMRADPRALSEVHALRRDVIVLRRVVLPQRQIFGDLAEGGHPFVDEASRQAFRRVTEHQGQILESLDTARSLLGSVFETHRGAIADQTNQIVRVLTVFSAILLPLTLVAGIFGMNFAEIPLAGEPLGFWILVGMMAVGAIGLWVYFSRRGFVGGVRLSELPRAVGLGLYHMGTAPIRVVAEGIESTFRLVTSNHDETEDEPER